MEDRFKIRAWDKTKKTMSFPDAVIQDNYSGNSIELIFNHTAEHGKYRSFEQCFKSEIVLMQCTGLKDSKGALIYESDLIRLPNNDIGCISFSQLGADYIIENYYMGQRLFQKYYDMVYAQGCEIIGNKYQHAGFLDVLSEDETAKINYAD